MEIERNEGYNYKVLISNIEIKIGSNRKINKAETKSRSPVTISETQPVKSPDDNSIKDCHEAHRPLTQHQQVQHVNTKTILPVDNPKILAEKHNDEKLVATLLFVGICVIVYHFW